MTERLIFEIAAPILTLILGWVTNAYRNKQKKEHDILDNVQQIIDMQNQHIGRCDEQLTRTIEKLNKLEVKYDHKVRAVKEAYDCTHDTSQCPVLIYDKNNHICDSCTHRNKNCPDD